VEVTIGRSGSLPSTRTVPFGRLLTASGTLAREVTLAGAATVVRDVAGPSGAAPPASWPIEILASPAARPAADAAISAVLAQRVWAPAPDRRARLMLLDAGAFPTDPGVTGTFRSAIAEAEPIRAPWMADAIARIARDADLQAAVRRVPQGIADARFSTTPWQRIADADDGQPLVIAAASGQQLIAVGAAPARSVATPILVRAMANALATPADLQSAEVVPIADEVLRLWSRPAVPLPAPRIHTVDEDDRRWLWLLALGLLAIETWMRRVRTRDASVEDGESLWRRRARRASKRRVARVA